MPKSPATPTVDIRGWAPAAARCPTCPFRPEGDAVLADRIRTELLGASQVCHHPRLHGKPETRLCRGARDEQLTLLYRLGYLEEPTDACFARTSAALSAPAAPAPDMSLPK